MTLVRFLEPGGILAEIDATPSRMRDEARASIVGQQVDWTLVLADVHDVASGKVRVLLRNRPNTLQYVAAQVDRVNYPWLTTLRAGDTVQVRGRITACSAHAIELDAADLARITGHGTAHPA